MRIREFYYSLSLRKRETIEQVFRFGIVGTIATAIHYGVYILILNLLCKQEIEQTVCANISYACGYFVGFCVNYVLTTYFTFKTKANKKNATGFTISHIINYLIETGVLNLLLLWDMDKTLAGLVTLVIAIPINFILLKIVFYVAGRK